eukprot:5608033-Prorocentrum_lima.AAC.1
MGQDKLDYHLNDVIKGSSRRPGLVYRNCIKDCGMEGLHTHNHHHNQGSNNSHQEHLIKLSKEMLNHKIIQE